MDTSATVIHLHNNTIVLETTISRVCTLCRDQNRSRMHVYAVVLIFNYSFFFYHVVQA